MEICSVSDEFLYFEMLLDRQKGIMSQFWYSSSFSHKQAGKEFQVGKSR